jgi:hypothetical protein
MNYDANLFCEIIETLPSVQFIRQETSKGFVFRRYQGRKGMVSIDYDDDNFCDEVGKIYLVQLGLEDMIPSLYPQEDVIDNKDNVETPITYEVGGVDDCKTCNGVGQLQKGIELIACASCDGTGTVKA